MRIGQCHIKSDPDPSLPGAPRKSKYFLVETEDKTQNDDDIIGADEKINSDNLDGNDYGGGGCGCRGCCDDYDYDDDEAWERNRGGGGGHGGGGK